MGKAGLRIIILLFCLALFFWGCEADKPIRIGFVGGTSGRGADLGISARDAIQLAVEKVNRQGGLDGRSIQLLVKDDQQNPDMARKAVQALIDEQVRAIVGPMTSDMAMVMTPIADQAGMLLISPTVTTDQLTGRDDQFLRVHATTRESADKSARYQLKSKAMKRVVAVFDLNNRAYCQSWLGHFMDGFTAGGGEMAGTVTFDGGEGPGFLALAREVLALDADGILVVANSMDAALFCQQVRKLHGDIRITLADWGSTERLLELGGRAIEGVTVVQTFDRGSQDPDYQQFRQAFMQRYQREPGFPGVYAYDAIQVLIEALRRQPKGEKLKATLLAMGEVKGLQGSFRFDAFGDVQRSNVSISVVQDNRFVFLE